MATWQFNLYLLPRLKIIERYSSVPVQVSAEEYAAAMDWWNGVTLPLNYDSMLGSILPKYTSWNKDAFTWGDEKSDSIAIIFENNAPVEIFVRLDVSKLEISLLEKIAHFAQQCDCLLLLDESRKLIEPDPLSLNYEIKRSNAYKFVLNPRGFLDELSKKLKGH